MLQNTLHIFVARFTEALLKSMECKPLEKILHWTNRAHVAPLYTNYKQYISNNRRSKFFLISNYYGTTKNAFTSCHLIKNNLKI